MNISRLHITVFLGISILLWILVLAIQGANISIDLLAPFGIVVSLLAAIVTWFEKKLWSIKYLHSWFVDRPDLRGTWKVTLQSDWIDPETSEVIPPITAYMGVSQSLTVLQLHLMTPESESWLIAHSIRSAPDNSSYEIAGVYSNKPKVHLRENRSNIHLGSLVLTTHGDFINYPDTLSGEYWTDRKTKGSIELSNRIAKMHTRFEDAERAFEQLDRAVDS